MVSSSFSWRRQHAVLTRLHMTRAASQRTNFHSSRLLRELSGLDMIDASESGSGFAEKLGMWLGLNDSITLCSVLNVPVVSVTSSTSVNVAVVVDDFNRTRATLEKLIDKGIGQLSSSRAISDQFDLQAKSLDIGSAFEPYRAFYLALQRDIDVGVRPLRARVRTAVSKASPALQKLAELDGGMEAMLAEREGKLLAQLPSLLKKRFARLFKAHQQRLVDAKVDDSPTYWLRTGGWLASFHTDLQAVLRAELELRLQPAQGLLEALNNEKTQQQ